MRTVDDQRLGALYRMVRIRLGWRQRDVAARAGVSQQLIALLESGRCEAVTLRTLRAVAGALGIRIGFTASWRGGEGERLLDQDHAFIVNQVAAILRAAGWQAIAEYTFSHFGERGSVDLVAWHPATRLLLIVEVKTRVYDLQATLSSFHRKVRLVPALLARERGWRAAAVGRLLVLPASTANRSAVSRHRETLDTVWPGRSREARRGIRRPDPHHAVAAIWFLSYTNRSGGKSLRAGIWRVRRPVSRSRTFANGPKSPS